MQGVATTLILSEARFSKWPDEPGDQVLTNGVSSS